MSAGCRGADCQVDLRIGRFSQRFNKLPDLVDIVVIAVIHFSDVSDKCTLDNINTVFVFIYSRGQLLDMIFNSEKI